jgi:hypothetical protein
MNTTTLYALALSLILGSTYAFGDPGGEGNNTNCNGQGNPSSPCEGNSGGSGGAGGGGGNGGEGGSGGNQEQTQTQTQEINNEVYQGTYVGVESDSNSAAESSSNSGSYSNSSGGSVRNNNSVSGGRSDASSRSSVGDTTATGGTSIVGDTTSNVGDTSATGGKSQASSGGNTQDLTVEGDTDNSVLIYEDEGQSASAASVFAGYCQTGASAQMQSGGFSVVNPEAFCNNIRMAGVYQEAYLWEMAHGKLSCSAEADGVWVDDQYQDACVNEKAAEYYGQYTYHLQEAHELLSKTEDIALVDAWAGYLIRPLAILALLILL